MVSLTAKAAEQLRSALAQQGKPNGFLRVRVTAGGCSGLNTELEITDQAQPGDQVFESNGAKVVVDSKSEIFVDGSQVDYESSLMKSGFVLSNPNAKSTCSCGTSFSV